MKTAIEQLIEKKQQRLDSLMGNPYPSVKVKVQINAIKYDLQMLEKMLPIEKQQIVDAYNQCDTDDSEFRNLTYEYENTKMTDAEYIEKQAKCSRNGEDYYQNTFKK